MYNCIHGIKGFCLKMAINKIQIKQHDNNLNTTLEQHTVCDDPLFSLDKNTPNNELEKEKLQAILKQYPNFYSLTNEEKFQIMQSFNNPNNEKSIPKQADNNSNNNNELFSIKEYSNIKDVNQKVEIYTTELAKNICKCTENKNWDKLSNDQKEEYLTLAKNKRNIYYNRNTQNLSDEDFCKELDIKMLELQSANFENITVEDFDKKTFEDQIDTIHNFNFQFTYTDEQTGEIKIDYSKTSDIQIKYLEEQIELTNAMVDYFNDNNIKDCYGNKFVKNSFIMSPDEMSSYLKKFNLENNQYGTQILKTDALIHYLKKKEHLTDEDNKRLKKLTDLNKGLKNLKPEKDYGQYKKFKENESYFKLYSGTTSYSDKLHIIHQYIKQFPEGERLNITLELISDMMREDAEFAAKFGGNIIQNSNNNEQYQIVNSNSSSINLVTSMNASILDQPSLEIHAQQTANDPTNAEITANNTTDQQYHECVSQYYRNSGNQQTQLINTDRVCNMEDENLKHNELQNIYNSDFTTSETKQYAATKLDRVNNKDNQLDLIKLYTQDRGCNNAMIESDLAIRIAPENQAKTIEILKTRTEQNDYNKSETIRLQNKLSDQVPKLHQSQQYKAHETMMQSKYSEVREHTASNIYKYHESVQAQAYKYTISTGDQKAIDAANSNYESMSPSAQNATKTEYQKSMLSESYNSESNTWESIGTLSEIVKKELPGFINDIKQFVPDNPPSFILNIENAFNAFKKKEIPLSRLLEIIHTTSNGEWAPMLIRLINTNRMKPDMLKVLLNQRPQLLKMLIGSLVSNGQGNMLLGLVGQNVEMTNAVIKAMIKEGAQIDKISAAKYIIKNKDNFSSDMLEVALSIVETNSYAFNPVEQQMQKDYKNKMYA